MRAQTSLRLVKISRADYDELVAHAREEAPNECCGYLWAEDGEVKGVRRAENPRRSPYGYEFDFPTLSAVNELDEEFQVGTYHSHPRGPAKPSQTDINLANYPDWLHLIVDPEGEGEVRGWWIRDGRVTEEELDVLDG